eukprot:TRINITY_DN32149_c0_g1_i1.p1 TRINITY_DN32149_c0_g1~~TRINITY_DN32149_c0_g1_i1.p1  ORF type:complete len:141 (+),score=41.78 TRINITY_DN32149_c0_g1_i1:42-425(+)
MLRSLVGSEMCIRDRYQRRVRAPALVIQNTSVTSLYSTGRTTGLVLESGASRTHATPIWDGYTLQHYIKRVDYGGEDLTRRLTSMFRAEGYPFSTDLDIATVRDIKEQMCYVAVSYTHLTLPTKRIV